MNKYRATLIVAICLLLNITPVIIFAQNPTNEGRVFWIGYQASSPNSTMKIYIGALATGDSVKIAISEGTPNEWIKTYWVPANTIVISDNIPRTGMQSAYLSTQGLHTNKGINITSKSQPIVAYAHLYEPGNAGATMILPENVLGTFNYVLTASQEFSNISYAVFHVIATRDSTWIEINPSNPTLNGWTPNGGPQPNGTYLVKLNKGDVYQVFGAISNGTFGYDLTGSTVQSVPNAQHDSHPVAVFCGNTKTKFGCSTNTYNSGDLIIQQVPPFKFWGTTYATAPFCGPGGPNTTTTTLYRVLVHDPVTMVYRNGILLSAASLVNGRYYEFQSNSADYITADKPVLVAQYMPAINTCDNNSGRGDVDMIYLSPFNHSISKSLYYRSEINNNMNFTSIVIPTAGLSTLTVNGVPFLSITFANRHYYDHPVLTGYSVAIVQGNFSSGQCIIQSNSPFTGIIYGLGVGDSYGYNLGATFNSSNSLPVKLISFTVTPKSQENLLRWHTAVEVNFNYFDIQRSMNGADFNTIGTIPGSAFEYHYLDKNFEKGINYYRLKMVDKDGQYTISPIKKVNNNNELEFALFPNPGRDIVNLKIESLQPYTTNVQVMSAEGKVVISQPVSVSVGTTIIPIITGGLPKGTYFIRAMGNGNQVRIIKFEKM